MATSFKPPATQRVYDVCVLGGGLGGAAAGALLSRRGYRVLVIDAGGPAPAADGGWLLPGGPSLLPGTRLLPAADSLLAEVGLVSDAARALEPLVPDLQLLYPRQRLDLAREPGHLAGELKRAWRADAERLARGLEGLAAAAEAGGHFLKAAPPLPPGGFLDGFALRKALKVAAQAAGAPREVVSTADPLAGLGGHPLAAALLALHRFLGRLDGSPAPLSVARLCGVALRGLHRVGPAALPLEDALRRKISEARGEVLGSAAEPARVESVAVDGSRLGAVRVAGMADGYLARAFVLAAPLRWLTGLLGPGAAERAARPLARLRPGRDLAVRHLVLRPAALPPGLGPAALVLGDGAAPDEAVLVEVSPARHDARKGHPEPTAGERLVSAWTLAPAEGGALAPAEARLAAALEEALPFHERHLIHRVATARVPHLLSVDQPALGVCGLPVKTPWKNLLLASREVIPGLGQEGELYAGLQAAAHAAALLGSKERPR